MTCDDLIKEIWSDIIKSQSAYSEAIKIANNLTNDQTNAVAHAYASAEWAYNSFGFLSEWLGDLKEWVSSQPQKWDEQKDQFNNEVGRRISEYMKKNDIPKDSLADLVLDALKNNQLVTNLNDARINSDINNNAPQSPTWNNPTLNWKGSSKPVPPSMIPDPSWESLKCLKEKIENTIGDVSDDIMKGIDGMWIHASPIALDINKSGLIETISLVNSKTYFDIDNDNFTEKLQWISPTDGWLAVSNINYS